MVKRLRYGAIKPKPEEKPEDTAKILKMFAAHKDNILMLASQGIITVQLASACASTSKKPATPTVMVDEDIGLEQCKGTYNYSSYRSKYDFDISNNVLSVRSEYDSALIYEMDLSEAGKEYEVYKERKPTIDEILSKLENREITQSDAFYNLLGMIPDAVEKGPAEDIEMALVKILLVPDFKLSKDGVVFTFENEADLDFILENTIKNSDKKSLYFLLDTITEAYMIYKTAGHRIKTPEGTDYSPFASEALQTAITSTLKRKDALEDFGIFYRIRTMHAVHDSDPLSLLVGGENYKWNPNELFQPKSYLKPHLYDTVKQLQPQKIDDKWLDQLAGNVDLYYLLHHLYPMFTGEARDNLVFNNPAIRGILLAPRSYYEADDVNGIWSNFSVSRLGELRKKVSEVKDFSEEMHGKYNYEIRLSAKEDVKDLIPELILRKKFHKASKLISRISLDSESEIPACESGEPGEFIAVTYAFGSYRVKDTILEMLDSYDMKYLIGKKEFDLMFEHSDNEERLMLAGRFKDYLSYNTVKLMLESAEGNKKLLVIDRFPDYPYLIKDVTSALTLEQKIILLNMQVSEKSEITYGDWESYAKWIKESEVPRHNIYFSLFIDVIKTHDLSAMPGYFAEELDDPFMVFDGLQQVLNSKKLREIGMDILVSSDSTSYLEENGIKTEGTETRNNLAYALSLLTPEEVVLCHDKFGIEYFERYPPSVLLKLPSVAQKGLTGEKTALLIATKEDYNDAFYRDIALYSKLAELGYSLMIYETDNDEDAFKFMKEFGNNKKSVSLLILAGHGTEKTIEFGASGITDTDHIDTGDIIQIEDIAELDIVEEEGFVALFSCSTGASDEAIGAVFSEKLNRVVYAPTIPTSPKRWVIDKDSGKVTGVEYFKYNSAKVFKPE